MSVGAIRAFAINLLFKNVLGGKGAKAGQAFGVQKLGTSRSLRDLNLPPPTNVEIVDLQKEKTDTFSAQR